MAAASKSRSSAGPCGDPQPATPSKLTASLPWAFSPHGVLKFAQAPREHTSDGDNTGWCVWECSNVLLRAVTSCGAWSRILDASREANSFHAAGLEELYRGSDFTQIRKKQSFCETATGPEDFPSWLTEAAVCDFSAGVGLVSIALASAGCHSVVATDIACQLPLLRENIAAAAATGDVSLSCQPDVAEYWWGRPLRPLREASLGAAAPSAKSGHIFDIVLASDILFIALRDGVTGSLAASLRGLAHCTGVVLMAWEERLPEQEQQWLDALCAGKACAGAHDPAGVDGSRGAPLHECEAPPHEWKPCPVAVSEFTGDMVTLRQEHAIDGVQGSVEGGTLVGDLFWEPPPIRMVLITPLNPPQGTSS